MRRKFPKKILVRNSFLEEALRFYESTGYEIVFYEERSKLAHWLNGEFSVEIFLATYSDEVPFMEEVEKKGALIMGSGFLDPVSFMSKIRQKEMMKKHAIPTPPFLFIEKMGQPSRKLLNKLLEEAGIEPPFIFKDPQKHSSRDMMLVKDHGARMYASMESFLKNNDALLIEHFFHGREISITILGEESAIALPLIEMCHKDSFFTCEAKHSFSCRVPAILDVHTRKEMVRLAERVFHLFGGHGLMRLDFILSDDGSPYLLELMTLCEGMVSNHITTYAAGLIGITFHELLRKQLHCAYSRRKRIKRNEQFNLSS